MAKEYQTLNLPTTLIEELKVWKMAFELSYGENMSYERIIRSMLDSLPDSDPAVVDTLDKLVQAKPDLMRKLASYSPDRN